MDSYQFHEAHLRDNVFLFFFLHFFSLSENVKQKKNASE